MAALPSVTHTKPELELDLSKASDVRVYLADTPFSAAPFSAASESGNDPAIMPLSGGTANWVYRIHLAKAYEGRKTVVVKHAKGWVKSMPGLKFDIVRQKYEVEALRRVGAWLSKNADPNAKVGVPAVHLFDEDKHVLIMDDAGETAISLKTLVQQGLVTSPTLAQELGSEIGTFLGGMHAWGRGNTELCAAVKGNEQAKGMSAWVFYGRLEGTLGGSSGLEKLSDPPLVIGEEDMKIVRDVAEETSRALLAVDDTFVMGDFWPGNIMVELDAQGGLKHISVLDWELAKTGLTGLDVGQFSAEIHLLRRSTPAICEPAASLILQHFWTEYKRTCAPSADDVKRASVQWGAHMAILGARVEWGDKAMTREIVLEGVRRLVDAHLDESESLDLL